MASLTNVVLKDRASTPVSHTYTPRDVVSGTGTLTETSGIPFGAPLLALSMKPSQSGNYVGRLKLSIPVVETTVVGGVTQTVVARTARADLRLQFDQRSTTEERKNFIGQLYSALGVDQTLIMKSFVDLESIWGA